MELPRVNVSRSCWVLIEFYTEGAVRHMSSAYLLYPHSFATKILLSHCAQAGILSVYFSAYHETPSDLRTPHDRLSTSLSILYKLLPATLPRASFFILILFGTSFVLLTTSGTKRYIITQLRLLIN